MKAFAAHPFFIFSLESQGCEAPELRNLIVVYAISLIAACAAASLAMGTRKGLQDT